jgi:predicted phage terminase large subunit-like protein
VRGLKWGSRRPDVMMLDDCEDDEAVMSPDRREKLMNQVQSAILPAGSPKTMYRVVGTVLHLAAMLEKLLTDPTWSALRYEACDDEVTEASILWPEMYDRQALLDIRQSFVNQERLDKFNMEYRNKPTDKSAALFREHSLLAMTPEDWLLIEKNKWPVSVGADFAISVKARRDYTVFVVGILGPDYTLYVVDVVRQRMDSEGVVTAMFETEQAWRLRTGGMPLQWYEEDGAIRKALGYALDLVMQKKGIFLNLCPMNPGTTDKRTRTMPIRAMVTAKRVKFDQEADWWPAFKEELLEFDRGAHDDQVDALAWLGIGISQSMVPESIEDEEEEEAFSYRNKYGTGSIPRGRNITTGY